LVTVIEGLKRDSMIESSDLYNLHPYRYRKNYTALVSTKIGAISFKVTGVLFVSMCILFVEVAGAETTTALTDRRIELGKKWMALRHAAMKAHLAAEDMKAALTRMETDRSNAASDIVIAKKGIVLNALSNLGNIACEFDRTSLCSLSKSIAETLNNAWHCGEGGGEKCLIMVESYGSAWAERLIPESKQLMPMPDPQTVVEAGKELRERFNEYKDTKDLEINLQRQFSHNVRSGIASLNKVESQIRQLEKEADAAWAAYQAEKARLKDEAKKPISESGSSQPNSKKQADQIHVSKKGKKERWVTLDDPDFPPASEDRTYAAQAQPEPSNHGDQGQSGKTIFYDPEVWRPDDWDKPKARPCEDLRGNRVPCSTEQMSDSEAQAEDRKTAEQLMAELDQIANEPDKGQSADFHAMNEGRNGSDKLAMLRGARSALGTYRQGRDLAESARSFGGGTCPNMVPYPSEALAILQRQGKSVPPMPSVDSMIAQAGGVNAAAAGLRQQIAAYRQTLASWPQGQHGDSRRLTELTMQHNQAILEAVECRGRSR
jgi:hypothetical protein